MLMRRRALVMVTALAALLASFVFASSALAKEPTGVYSIFKQCPRTTKGVNLCILSTVTGGEVKIAKESVPIENPLTLQGGIIKNTEVEPETETFVGALNGETLSKTPQKVPGGLLGLVKCNEIKGFGLIEDALRLACEWTFENFFTGVNAVTELAKPAGDITISKNNLVDAEGTALGLPVKVKLENPLLGSECYVGSSTSPLELNLTTGTTEPKAPNTPISGKIGKFTFKEGVNFLEINGNVLVNNEFSVPAATGCGGIFSFLLDPIIDAKLGLPSASGNNTAIQDANINEATAKAVIESEK